jgi:hypothetical protein
MSYANLNEAIGNLEGRYPVPQDELRRILDYTRGVLDGTVKRVEGLKLSTEGKKITHSFREYVRESEEHNISPIGVVVTYDIEDGKVVIKESYMTDFAMTSAHGWGDVNGLPELNTNGLSNRFRKGFYGQGDDISKDIFEKKAERFIPEHLATLRERANNSTLSRGDEHFGESSYQLFLEFLKEHNKTVSIETEELAGKLLDDRRALRYINWQGEEIIVPKTPFEAWECFKRENPVLVKRITDWVNSSEFKTGEDLKNMYSSLCHAYTLLRLKGMPKYPHITK